MTQERWLPVVGYEGLYEVSDRGRVRSLDRILVRRGKNGPMNVRRRGQILKPGTVESGHQLVVLGRGVSKLVHALVLIAFVGPRPPRFDSRHLDGDPANNQLKNLCWGTRSENILDAVRHGTYRNGARPGTGSWRAKLTEADIPAIRARLASGETCQDIARDYPVRASNISHIKQGKTWRHV